MLGMLYDIGQIKPLNRKRLAHSDEEDVAELVAFACELCDKRFKSKAAFTNHERCAACG